MSARATHTTFLQPSLTWLQSLSLRARVWVGLPHKFLCAHLCLTIQARDTGLPSWPGILWSGHNSHAQHILGQQQTDTQQQSSSCRLRLALNRPFYVSKVLAAPLKGASLAPFIWNDILTLLELLLSFKSRKPEESGMSLEQTSKTKRVFNHQYRWHIIIHDRYFINDASLFFCA